MFLLLLQEINGVATDIAVTVFADRVFIVVTQVGTFGTLVRAVLLLCCYAPCYCYTLCCGCL